MLYKLLPWWEYPPNSFLFKNCNAILHRTSAFTDTGFMVSLLQISDWHHGYTTELRASCQTSSSVVASATKTIYPPTFLTSILSMNRRSFPSNLVLHYLSIVLIQHLFLVLGVEKSTFCVFLLFHNCSARTSFLLSFQQHPSILASLCTFSCHYFHLTNFMGSNLEPVKFRFQFCLSVPL